MAQNVPKSIDVTLKKVDKSKLGKPITDDDLLKGASFTISKYPSKESQGKDESWGDHGSKTLRDEKQGDTYTLNGIFEFKDLSIGYYVIDEIVFPTGYVQVAGEPSFEVKADNTGHLVIELVNNPDNLIRLVDGEFVLFIGNTPGAELPHAGGPGTKVFAILGAMLMALAGAGMILIRKKRRHVV